MALAHSARIHVEGTDVAALRCNELLVPKDLLSAE